MKTLETYIYKLQKTYEKRYKTKIWTDLHVKRLYLRKLLKEMKNYYSRDELKKLSFELKVFNEWHWYHLTEWFFNLLNE